MIKRKKYSSALQAKKKKKSSAKQFTQIAFGAQNLKENASLVNLGDCLNNNEIHFDCLTATKV